MFDSVRKFCDSLYNNFVLKYKKITVGKNLIINGKLWFQGSGKMIIGDNVRITSRKRTNPLGGESRTSIVLAQGAVFRIGNNVGISNSFFKIKEAIIIHDHVDIGGDCKFYDSDMHSVEYNHRKEDPDIHVKTKEIVIEDGAWIGAHCIILKGVTIGARSVIGAGSVVTCDIPSDELWAGNPARFIKKINVNVEETK